MSNVKLSVTIVLPGRTMMTSQECEKNPKVNYRRHVIMLPVKRFDDKSKKAFTKNEPLEFHTRKCQKAKQVIRMSDEAYEYMTSVTCPEWFFPIGGPNQWKKLSNIQRLEYHLDRVCASLGGISYTYDIYKD